jgi:uncharacterized membrane protein YgcG
MPRSNFSKIFFHLLTLIALALLVLPAFAQDDDEQTERIRSFDSIITVNSDGSMRVQETIVVEAAGDKIRHGIYRDFPTRYKDRLNNHYSVLFDIVGVERDGNPETYHTEGLSNSMRVYFGDSNTLVSHGEHRYVFTYNTNRQLGFFKDHDELYWNVTGFGWIFPIDHVTATVMLPAQINFVNEIKGDVGTAGESGKIIAGQRDAQGNPHFEAEHLLPLQALNIVVTWPKGLIAPPSREQKIKWFLHDNLATAAGLVGLSVVLLYYVIAWVKVGRDPAAGTIVPLYEPPDNMSPASVRYLKLMAFDEKCFTSGILGLAAKGCLTIDNSKDSYRLIQKNDTGSFKTLLSNDEKVLKDKLFSDESTLRLTSSNATKINGAKKALSNTLHLGMEKIYFVTNAEYLWPGLALTILTALAMLLGLATQPGGGGQIPVALFMTVWLSGWTVGVGVLLHAVVRAWRSSAAGAVGITLFSIPFIIGEIFGLGVLAWALSVPACLMIVALIASNAIFHHLLKAPTRAGRQLLDRVDGFKMFLSAVDGERMNTLSTPGRTPELFERFLPYALALDVEHAWAEQFSQVLAATATAGTSGSTASYSPSWYTGAFSGSSPVDFASSFGSSFSSAVSSSSSPPGSSSGVGGGGGSSGGGGGGGGGGGW